MADYTPGPWHASGRSANGLIHVHASKSAPRMVCICACVPEPGRGNDTEANALLIAAAPDCLAACRMVLADLTNGPLDDLTTRCAMEILAAAIAKAEGREVAPMEPITDATQTEVIDQLRLHLRGLCNLLHCIDVALKSQDGDSILLRDVPGATWIGHAVANARELLDEVAP